MSNIYDRISKYHSLLSIRFDSQKLTFLHYDCHSAKGVNGSKTIDKRAGYATYRWQRFLALC